MSPRECAAVTGVEITQNTVYLAGLSPEDARHVREDFRAYPFPDWEVEELSAGAAPPLRLMSGQAILVIGCGRGDGPPGCGEAMWLLRLFACGCPWVAVARGPGGPSRELCEAAGVSAYLVRPFSPAELRKLIWYHAVPHAGRTPILPLTCERLIRYFAVLGADILLKFTADTGRTGYLTLRGGQPVHATVLDGPDGAAGLREILNWGKGKVLGQPLPPDVRPNLPDRPEAWVQLLRTPAGGGNPPLRPVPGGREACDRVAQNLPDVTACALVDLRSGQVAATAPGRDPDVSHVAAVTDLFRMGFRPADPDEPAEQAEEIVVLGRDGWWAATRLGAGAFALVVSADGQAHLGLARQVFAAAADELERRSGMVVEAAEVG